MAKPKAPSSLQDAGRGLWTQITGKYDLRSDELAVLEAACRTSDIIAAMESAWSDEGFPMTTKGSMGQQVAHPFISELRQYRSAHASLLRQLKLPDESDTPEARSTQARAAAQARWSRRGA